MSYSKAGQSALTFFFLLLASFWQTKGKRNQLESFPGVSWRQNTHLFLPLLLQGSVLHQCLNWWAEHSLGNKEPRKSHCCWWCERWWRKEITLKLRCSSSSALLPTAGLGYQNANRDLEKREVWGDMTQGGQLLGGRVKGGNKQQSASESGYLISPLSRQGDCFGKPNYRQITGINFSKNREVSHTHGWMHGIDCPHLERFAHLARMKTINWGERIWLRAFGHSSRHCISVTRY